MRVNLSTAINQHSGSRRNNHDDFPGRAAKTSPQQWTARTRSLSPESRTSTGAFARRRGGGGMGEVTSETSLVESRAQMHVVADAANRVSGMGRL